MLLYFDVGGRQIVFILYLVIFSLRYLTISDVERHFPIGSLSIRMIFMGAPLQVFTISKQNPNWWFWFFMNSLSTECTSHKKKFKRILAANVLRFHGSFLEIIGNEPSGKYKDPTHHNFHHRKISVLVDTKKFNWDLSQMARWSHCRF